MSKATVGIFSIHPSRASIILAAIALTSLAGCTLLQQRATAQTTETIVYQQPNQTLQVTGQGTQTIPTSLTQVNLGVLVEAKTAQEAQQRAAQQSTAVVEWVRSQKVEKLQTAGISLSPVYDYSDNKQVLKGYQATNTISFRAPTESAGAIIDKAVEVGATQIDGVSFVADDAAIEAARQRALQSAVKDAQQQADTVLAALGLSRQEVASISIGAVSEPPPEFRPAATAARLSADTANTPVIGQEQEINAQVTLLIRY
ncbi:MAG: SIMPL domain-containing protein [Phormidesmis sp.]